MQLQNRGRYLSRPERHKNPTVDCRIFTWLGKSLPLRAKEADRSGYTFFKTGKPVFISTTV